MVDIVILWVNPEDNYWIHEYEKYSKIEGRKIENSIRYRDYGTLKYILRGIEQNMSWVNKVHLILSNPNQLPHWINTNCDKLEINYHKEFVPVNLLPTFNSNVIELYLHNIKTLADYYILFNDDQFILNKIHEEMFIEGSSYIAQIEEVPFKFNLDQTSTFKMTLDNNFKLLINYEIDNNLKLRQFKHFHLPEIHNKSLEDEIVENQYKIPFLTSLVNSRFRSDKNFTNWVFGDILKARGDVTNKPIYKNSKYIKLADDLDFNMFRGYDLVCFNDNGNIDFEKCVKELKNFLHSIYPNKSCFEV